MLHFFQLTWVMIEIEINIIAFYDWLHEAKYFLLF